MIKLINIITQIIIVLGCCAILIFTLSIDLIKYINQEIGEIGDTQHRIILRYNNEFIPVVKNIIADFNLTNNIKS